jgi:formylglycine-generating enzyme required for sulfatase activity
VLDMAGTVWDGRRSLWGKIIESSEYPCPYRLTDGRENLAAGQEVLRVTRGGTGEFDEADVGCGMRSRCEPDEGDSKTGFRVVMHP